MKKVKVIMMTLMMSLMFVSCNKEDVQPENTNGNIVKKGNTLRVDVIGGSPNIRGTYTEMNGTVRNNYPQPTGGFTNVDLLKTYTITGTATQTFTLYPSGGGSPTTYTTQVEANFKLYLDNNIILELNTENFYFHY